MQEFIFLDLRKNMNMESIIKNETINNVSSVSRMQINDSKAGMQNIDKEKINAIILKHSKSKLLSKICIQFNTSHQ